MNRAPQGFEKSFLTFAGRQRHENVGQGCVGAEPRHQAVTAIASGPIATLAIDANDGQAKLASECKPTRIALFDRGYRLAGHSSERGRFLAQQGSYKTYLERPAGVPRKTLGLRRFRLARNANPSQM